VDGLDALAGAVVDATSAIGRPPDDRPFRGHVTVARTKGRVARCPLVGQPVAAAWRATDFALVRSDLHPHGARYTTVATFGLR
jgi:2'-5' RNA ligase